MVLYKFLFIPILLIDTSHIDSNNTDVIITYAGHSEVDMKKSILKPKIEPDIAFTTEVYETADIVFVPNDKPVFRNQDVLYAESNVRVSPTQSKQNPGKTGEIHITDAPKEDILFISGKNNENIDKPVQKSARETHRDATVVRTSGKKTKTKPVKIDCKHLNCNNTVKSICAYRLEDQKKKYRLFLNDCYFRKVNCEFHSTVNRYVEVSIGLCKDVGMHFKIRPNIEKYQMDKIVVQPADTRRVFSSRRSLSMSADGNPCSHTCPISCTEDYSPECAFTSSGARKVFLNHCKLDEHSCIHNVAWYRRPLSECVGNKKADIQQNRGFIGYLQRAGIVDKRGKLVVS